MSRLFVMNSPYTENIRRFEMYNFTPYSYTALPVANIKEAETAPIDISGNPVLYFNRVENEIYLKQFDMATGKTFFGKYIFAVAPVKEEPKDDVKEMLNLLNEKYDYLYRMFTEKETNSKEKKAVKNDE